jgi:hypothetical protein
MLALIGAVVNITLPAGDMTELVFGQPGRATDPAAANEGAAIPVDSVPSWTALGTEQTIAMSDPVLIGLALTSHGTTRIPRPRHT